MKHCAPIALFVYNRPLHTEKTVTALMQNELAAQSDLIIFSDGPKSSSDYDNVTSIREFARTVKGFKSVNIIERSGNWGLSRSIISGVTEVIDNYGHIIVLEDDLESSPYFLTYINEALEYYQNEKTIFSITGYNLPECIIKIPSIYSQDVYFNYRCHSWGWGTWKDRWEQVDWNVSNFKEFLSNTQSIKSFQRGGQDLLYMLIKQMTGKIDSWAIRWCFTHFLEDAFCVYPVRSLIRNIGFDNSGVHCSEKMKKKYTGPIDTNKRSFRFANIIQVDDQIIENFRQAYQIGVLQKLITHFQMLRIKYESSKT